MKKWFNKLLLMLHIKRQPLPVAEVVAFTDAEHQPKKDLFYCHYCYKGFEVNESKDVFPMSVKALYKDYYFQGIGIKCPYCFKDCIYG